MLLLTDCGRTVRAMRADGSISSRDSRSELERAARGHCTQSQVDTKGSDRNWSYPVSRQFIVIRLGGSVKPRETSRSVSKQTFRTQNRCDTNTRNFTERNNFRQSFNRNVLEITHVDNEVLHSPCTTPRTCKFISYLTENTLCPL